MSLSVEPECFPAPVVGGMASHVDSAEIQLEEGLGARFSPVEKNLDTFPSGSNSAALTGITTEKLETKQEECVGWFKTRLNSAKEWAKRKTFKMSVAIFAFLLFLVGVIAVGITFQIVPIESFDVVLLLVFVAMTLLELLRERLAYLTDNNLVFKKLPAREFLCQSRNIVMAWLFIPAALATGDRRTIMCVSTEVLVSGTVLIASTVNEDFFTGGSDGEESDGGRNPYVMAALLIVLLFISTTSASTLCLKGEIMTKVEQKQTDEKEKKKSEKRSKVFFRAQKASEMSPDEAKDQACNKVNEGTQQAEQRKEQFENANNDREGFAMSLLERLRSKLFAKVTSWIKSKGEAAVSKKYDKEVGPWSWKALMAPTVGFLAAVASAVLYIWVKGTKGGAKEDGDSMETDGRRDDEGDPAAQPVDQAKDAARKAAGVLMVLAWTAAGEAALGCYSNMVLSARVETVKKRKCIQHEATEEQRKEFEQELETLRNTPAPGLPDGFMQVLKRELPMRIAITLIFAVLAKMAIAIRGAMMAFGKLDGFVFALEAAVAVSILVVFYIISAMIVIKTPGLRCMLDGGLFEVEAEEAAEKAEAEAKAREEKAKIEAEIKTLLEQSSIDFETSSHALTPAGQDVCDTVAAKLKLLSLGSTIQVHGHTQCGSQEGEGAHPSIDKCTAAHLSEKRCQVVIDRIKAQGVGDRANFEPFSWGCTEPTILSKKLVRILIK